MLFRSGASARGATVRGEEPIPGPTSHPPASEPFLRPGCALASIPHPLPSLPGVRRDPPGRALADARAVWAAASTAQRPLPRHAGRNLLLATPGDRRAPCSPRRPCNKPCSPGWAEYEQEWIPWCTTTSTASLRHRALLPSLCIRMKLKQVQDGQMSRKEYSWFLKTDYA